MLADVVFPSLNPADYTPEGQACPWYQERKASGSVIACTFPSTTVVIAGAIGLLAMIFLGRS